MCFSKSAFDKLCFGKRQRERERQEVVCVWWRQFTEGPVWQPPPLSNPSNTTVTVPLSLFLLPLSPFTLVPVSQYSQQRLRDLKEKRLLSSTADRTLLNISLRYYPTPLVNRDVLVFCFYFISLSLSCQSAVCAPVTCLSLCERCSLFHSRQSLVRHELLTIYHNPLF